MTLSQLINVVQASTGGAQVPWQARPPSAAPATAADPDPYDLRDQDMQQSRSASLHGSSSAVVHEAAVSHGSMEDQVNMASHGAMG